MEEVAHRVDEDPAGLAPAIGFTQALRMQGEAKSLWEMLGEAFGDALGVAVLAPWAHLIAAGGGVPGRIRPLDSRRGVGHYAENLTRAIRYVYRG